MLPALFLVLTLVTVPLAGGRLMALDELQLARAWTSFAQLPI
jgi:hypothetical protein